VAKGIHNIERLLAATNELPAAAQAAVDMLADQLRETQEKIDAVTARIEAAQKTDPLARRLATIPGVGGRQFSIGAGLRRLARPHVAAAFDWRQGTVEPDIEGRKPVSAPAPLSGCVVPKARREVMANGRRHGNRDTQFGPEHPQVRAIDLDPGAGGFHQGAQPSCCNSDAVYMAATGHMPDPNKALAPREPSILGPRTMGERQAIALRILHRGEAGAQAALPGEGAGVLRRVGVRRCR
jgi:hypothetical protein